VVTLRLPAFRFLQFFFFVARVEQSETRERQSSRTFVPGFRCAQSGLRNDETGITEDRKAGPTPGFLLSKAGFAFDVTVFCWRAISLRFAHDEDSGAKERREARALGHERSGHESVCGKL
jgi:hypothetical protein